MFCPSDVRTHISNVQALLPCPLAEFLCKYLGLVLSLRRLTRNQVQPYVDSIADQLQGWKANLMTKTLCSLECSSTILWQLSFQHGLSKQLIKFGDGSCGEVAGMHLGATA
jgi:hypothetical protein